MLSIAQIYRFYISTHNRMAKKNSKKAKSKSVKKSGKA
jgi:hypothetical protein